MFNLEVLRHLQKHIQSSLGKDPFNLGHKLATARAPRNMKSLTHTCRQNRQGKKKAPTANTSKNTGQPNFVLNFIYSIIFREREGGKKRGRKTSMCERNISVWLPLAHPLLGTWPETQAWALTGNQTNKLLVYRLMLNPLSHTSQGWTARFNPQRLQLSNLSDTRYKISGVIYFKNI